jgi:translation initiation factor IF-3
MTNTVEVDFIQRNIIRVNEKIRAREVRLIGTDGAQLGIRSFNDALDIAKRQKLDLVEVAANAKPPVCKIMDFGKYKYDLAKKAKENRKSQKNVSIKELKFRLKIDTHDFETKVASGVKFLQQGHRLKVIIMFRGREVVYRDRGKELQARIVESFKEVGNMDRVGNLEGHNMILLVSPKNVPV